MALRHLVLLRFKDDIPADTRAALEQEFASLATKIDGISAFEWGLDESPEPLAKGLTHIFNMTFVDAAARDAYLPHPVHQAFVARLKPTLADILVLDYPV
ncbi:Dabb family protein [Silvimonas iriomotensis]|uniref:Stress protein n=1 Tax=Silvimonas iriomotensis TaxID=449662 RepID=A0ABQ2PF20_9NEIS|nr:Dabb family protein [Silvimonas iriomotensis]GGP23844.1 stress protein [Silvimonas iriomotensis]